MKTTIELVILTFFNTGFTLKNNFLSEQKKV
jgi:hypothetical protein